LQAAHSSEITGVFFADGERYSTSNTY